MKRIKSFFWQLNTPFLFYFNLKTATVNNLIRGIQFAYPLCIALYALISATQQWIGVTFLLKNQKKSLRNAI